MGPKKTNPYGKPLTPETASRRRTRAYRQSLLSALLALGLVVLLQNIHVLPRLEWLAEDFLKRLAATSEPIRPALEFVVLDQKSLDMGAAEYGLPWPRRTLAQALHFLQAAGARWILFDFVLSEPSLYGPEDDQALAAVARAGGRVCLPVVTRPQGPLANPQALSWMKPLVPLDPVIAPDAQVPKQAGGSLPIPVLAAAAGVVGDARLVPDADGVVRRIQPLVRLDGLLVPAFGLAPAVDAKVPGWIRLYADRIELGGRLLPLDRTGCLVLRYPGDWQRYPRTSLIDVVASEQALSQGRVAGVDPARFSGKVVVVGVTAAELFTPYKIPLQGATPDCFIAATTWTAAQGGRVYQECLGPFCAWPLVLLMIGLGTVIGRQRFSVAVFLGAVTAGLFLATGLGLFFTRGLILELISPLGGFLTAFVLSFSLSYSREQRQKHFIQNAFSQMLSPLVLQGLMNEPERLAAGGELAEVTMYFSDLAGFTDFSERLDPHTVVSLLNTYFQEMIETIVDETGGYVDKFIGDAVMAFWGAPLPDRDHAFKACQAALRNQEKLEKLRARLGGHFPLRMRIGIHTGPVVVGMMGSQAKLNYTVIGDAVNLASRLEGANKAYGTEIILSDSTYHRLKDRAVVREVDHLQVKGKSQSTIIYELLGLPKQMTPLQLRWLNAYQEGMTLYHERKFKAALQAFQRAAEARGDDPVLEIYLERCRRYVRKPPPASWDGVIELKHK